MTRDASGSVRLSSRDWVAIAAGIFGIISTIGASYQSIGTDLATLRASQKAAIDRLERMEADILRLEGRIFQGVPGD